MCKVTYKCLLSSKKAWQWSVLLYQSVARSHSPAIRAISFSHTFYSMKHAIKTQRGAKISICVWMRLGHVRHEKPFRNSEHFYMKREIQIQVAAPIGENTWPIKCIVPLFVIMYSWGCLTKTVQHIPHS